MGGGRAGKRRRATTTDSGAATTVAPCAQPAKDFEPFCLLLPRRAARVDPNGLAQCRALFMRDPSTFPLNPPGDRSAIRGHSRELGFTAVPRGGWHDLDFYELQRLEEMR